MAVDEGKDQSYALAALAPSSLARLRFPLGSLRKPEVREHAAQLVLFNHELSPGQERNLEREINKSPQSAEAVDDAEACRVLDRSTLILDIFAQRAQSHDRGLRRTPSS